jgi:hypothetical protein
MTERRHGHYLPRGPVPEDTEPEHAAAHLSRAWLQPAEGGDQPWGMTMEQGTGPAMNHDGQFDDLIAMAREAGIEDYYVWSPTRENWVQFTEQTVRREPCPYAHMARSSRNRDRVRVAD